MALRMPDATSRQTSQTRSPSHLGNRFGSARECIWRCRRHVRAPGTALGTQLQPRHYVGKRAGIIDPGYRGEIRCKLVNLSDEPYTVYPLERIAQLVFLPFVNAAFMTCDSLPESSRGEDGYGSTGAM